MLKKWLCFLVIVSVLLTLPACGRKQPPSVETPQTTPTQAATAPTAGDSVPTDTIETQPADTIPQTAEPSTGNTAPQTPTTPAAKPETPQQTQPTQPSQLQETQPTPTIPPQIEIPPVPTYGHTPLAKTDYYQYSTMTATEKQLYNTLVAGIENLQNEIPVSGISIGTDAGMALFYRVMADHPEYFWVSRKVSVSYDPRTMKVQSFVVLYTDGEKADSIGGNSKPVAVADREKIIAKRTALNEKIGQIMGSIPANYPEIDREKLIYDYIVTHLQYDSVAAGQNLPVDSILPHAYDIYGAAIEGKAVCEGYSKLFQYLCYHTGINVAQISGTANGGGHMWNAVELDGDWYEIDVTWGDGSDALIYYKYFNLTHTQMAQDHTADPSKNPFPQCNGTKYRYADYYALKVLSATQVSDNYKEVVDRQIAAGSGYLIVYKNGINMDTQTNNALIFDDTALIHQYARQRGYRLNLSRSYIIYDDFFYIPCTVTKL